MDVLTVAGVDDLDLMWSAAAAMGAVGEAAAGTPPGVARLAYLLRVYNCAMGGGLGFAFEVNEDYRIVRAIDAMRFFGLAELAGLFEDLRAHMPDWDYIESRVRYDTFVDLADGIAGVGGVMEAFRAKAAGAPGEFGLTR